MNRDPTTKRISARKPREPIRSMMLEMFKPSPVTSIISSATPDTLFINGAHCWRPPASATCT